MLQRGLLRTAALMPSVTAPLVTPRRARAAEAPPRFAVELFQPTSDDTRRAFEPFFARIADALGHS